MLNRPMILVLIVACAGFAGAQNLLTNPGFESGSLTGWTAFGNAYLEASNPPQFVPNSGGFMVSMFGTFNPNFDTVMFQTFPAAPGEAYEMDGFGRHYSGDALTNGNRLFMKIVFRDLLGNELAGVDRDLVNATYPTDVWVDATPIQLVAPPGTTSVEAFLIFSQIPATAPGAAHADDIVFRKMPVSLEMNQESLPLNSDLTIRRTNGLPNAVWGQLFTLNPLNASAPLTGPIGGLHIPNAEVNQQLPLVIVMAPPFGGFLDANGEATSIVPGLAGLTGITIWSVCGQLNGGFAEFSNVAEYTFQ